MPWFIWVLIAYCVIGILLGEVYDYGRKRNNSPFVIHRYLFVLALWWVFVIGFPLMKWRRKT